MALGELGLDFVIMDIPQPACCGGKDTRSAHYSLTLTSTSEFRRGVAYSDLIMTAATQARALKTKRNDQSKTCCSTTSSKPYAIRQSVGNCFLFKANGRQRAGIRFCHHWASYPSVHPQSKHARSALHLVSYLYTHAPHASDKVSETDCSSRPEAISELGLDFVIMDNPQPARCVGKDTRSAHYSLTSTSTSEFRRGVAYSDLIMSTTTQARTLKTKRKHQSTTCRSTTSSKPYAIRQSVGNCFLFKANGRQRAGIRSCHHWASYPSVHPQSKHARSALHLVSSCTPRIRQSVGNRLLLKARGHQRAGIRFCHHGQSSTSLGR